MKYSTLLLIFLCCNAYSQNLENDLEQVDTDKIRAAGKVLEAAQDCAAIANIAGWNTTEHFRFMAIILKTGKAVLKPMLEEFLTFDIENASETPKNPFTEKPFDPKTDELVNLLGFASIDEYIVFQLGSEYGTVYKKFFDEIPYGGSLEMWKTNIAAEFDKRNCSLIR